MKSVYLNLSVGFCIFLLLAEFAFAQEKNPTVYPYGGEVFGDTIRFSKTADFEGAKFKSRADFRDAHFDSRADFFSADFKSWANFRDAKFKSWADFRGAKFKSRADFRDAHFDSRADFPDTHFDGLTYFVAAHFDSLANFRFAHFDSLAYFGGAVFKSRVDFGHAHFMSRADFEEATFNNSIDFRDAEFDSSTWVDFSLATIHHTVFVGKMGSPDIQRYNFLRAQLLPAEKQKIPADTSKNIPEQIIEYPGAKIILFGPVDLKIQIEKFKFIELYDRLNYYAKKDIISSLKDGSFDGNKYNKERFELDYIFAKSTIYQKKSVRFQEYSAFHWISWVQFLYKMTMGLGYRPFRLVYWIVGLIVLFAVIYIWKFPEAINQYVQKTFDDSWVYVDTGRNAKNFSTILNCFYFSVMVLLTVRLKGNILTRFDNRQKKLIVIQWLLGFSIIVAFLALSKSGSILHTLKSLFVG